MTVMTAMEAKREQHRDAVIHQVPDAISLAEAMMEDLSEPQEFHDHGFDSLHEVATHIEEQVVKQIKAEVGIAPDDAGYECVQAEVDYAKTEVFRKVMDEFAEYVAGSAETPARH